MEPKSNTARPFWYGVVFLGAFALDRVTKYLALRHLADGPKPILPGLRFNLVFNRGISLSLFADVSTLGQIILISLVLFLIMGFSYHTYQMYQQGKSIFAEVCILAGAISNIIDRYLYVGVVDFIEMSAFGYAFPTYNVADIFITFGVIAMMLGALRAGKTHPHA